MSIPRFKRSCDCAGEIFHQIWRSNNLDVMGLIVECCLACGAKWFLGGESLGVDDPPLDLPGGWRWTRYDKNRAQRTDVLFPFGIGLNRENHP